MRESSRATYLAVMTRLPALEQQPTSRRGWLFVAVVAVVLAIALVTETRSVGQPVLTRRVLATMASTAVAVLLAYPFPALGLAVAVLLSVAEMLVPGMPHGGGTGLITLGFLVGFLAYRLPGRWSLGAWLVAGAGPGLGLLVVEGTAWELMFYLLFLAPAWLVGVLLQREQRRAEELARLAAELAAEREHRTATALAAERTRIARELHDAVAHHVSVMTLQVGVVRRRLDALPTEQDTLLQAERLGRQSVDELRRIVGLVRPGGPELAPVPSLAHLEDLVEQVRRAGTPVELVQDGPLRELGSALDVSAYRIVQEALTNALRHAPGAPVRVCVSSTPVSLQLSVTDAGPLVGEVEPGNGLTGMAERVGLFGGRLTYGPGTPTGFAVTAELPLGSMREPVA